MDYSDLSTQLHCKLLSRVCFYSNEAMRVYPALLAALQRRVELGSGGKMIAS